MEPSMSLDEAEAVVATKTMPKVTAELIKGKINVVDYTSHGHTTVCFVTMRNGFKFVGTSTPVSPANYDPEVGKRHAFDNAFRQIWTHEGYLLRERLAAEAA